MITLILNAYPECIKIRDADNNLPIHLVSYHHKGRIWINISELTETIVNWYPQGLNELDSNNDIPFLIAIKQRSPDELLSYFLQRSRQTATSELKCHFVSAYTKKKKITTQQA